jgi:hypothetical protein
LGERKRIFDIMGINIEDQNSEHYYINPRNVVYVKQRDNFWKILLVGGEVIITKNSEGAQAIIRAIK